MQQSETTTTFYETTWSDLIKKCFAKSEINDAKQPHPGEFPFKARNTMKIWAVTGQNLQSDCAPWAKTQISLGICPVWSESSPSARRNIGSSATHWAHRCSGWSESSLSARRNIGSSATHWAHRCSGWSESSMGAQSFCLFCHVVAHMSFCYART